MVKADDDKLKMYTTDPEAINKMTKQRTNKAIKQSHKVKEATKEITWIIKCAWLIQRRLKKKKNQMIQVEKKENDITKPYQKLY